MYRVFQKNPNPTLRGWGFHDFCCIRFSFTAYVKVLVIRVLYIFQTDPKIEIENISILLKGPKNLPCIFSNAGKRSVHTTCVQACIIKKLGAYFYWSDQNEGDRCYFKY